MVRTFALVLILMAGLACNSNPTGTDADLDYDGLVAALRRGGAQVTPGGSISQPFFSVSGRVIAIGNEDVQVFEYSDAAAAQTEARRVSPDGAGIGTTLVTWVAPPHFFVRGRVLALYVGRTASVLTALSGAMGPQIAGR